MKPYCEDCLYFVKGERLGWCYRMPPVGGGYTENGSVFSAKYPRELKSAWCGEWKDKNSEPDKTVS